MRSHHTPPGVAVRPSEALSTSEALSPSEAVRSVSRNAGDRVPRSHVPLEWLDAGSWRLPSGKALAEFALQAGFLAPLLFRAERSGTGKPSGMPSSEMAGSVASPVKDFGKGDGR